MKDMLIESAIFSRLDNPENSRIASNPVADALEQLQQPRARALRTEGLL
jgi:hypothetical protein